MKGLIFYAILLLYLGVAHTQKLHADDLSDKELVELVKLIETLSETKNVNEGSYTKQFNRCIELGYSNGLVVLCDFPYELDFNFHPMKRLLESKRLNTKLLSVILNNKKKVFDYRNSFNADALMLAIFQENEILIRFIIENKLYSDNVDKSNKNAFHYLIDYHYRVCGDPMGGIRKSKFGIFFKLLASTSITIDKKARIDLAKIMEIYCNEVAGTVQKVVLIKERELEIFPGDGAVEKFKSDVVKKHLEAIKDQLKNVENKDEVLIDLEESLKLKLDKYLEEKEKNSKVKKEEN